MATHDYNLANQDGASFRSDLNNALSAIVSNNSSSTAPATTFAHQIWVDTTANVIKQRNAANDAWVELWRIDGGFNAKTFSSNVTLNAQSDLRFADSDSSNWVAFQAPATVASNVTWTLPSADGSADQALTTDGSGTLSWADAGGTTDNITEGNTSAEVVDTGSDGHFKVVTEGTEALRVNASQQVGIGTASASDLLHLAGASGAGTARFEDTASTNSIGKVFGYAGGLYLQSRNNTNYGDIVFRGENSSGTAERARIDSSGHLLLNTTTVPTTGTLPDARFSIKQSTDSGAAGFQVEANGDQSVLTCGYNGSTWDIGTTYRSTGAHRDLTFSPGAIQYMRLDANGYLTLYKNASSNEARIYLNGTGTRIVYNDSSGNMTFYTNSAARAYFGYTGGFYPVTDNAMPLGAGGQRWTAVYAVNGTIQTSDLREKTDIATSSLGTDFIKQLRPVSYKFKVGENIVTTDEETEAEIITPRPGERTHWGFVAQEVKEVVDATGVDFGGWILTDKDDPDSTQGLRYDQFIAPLTKALQEAIDKIETLEAKVAALEAA